MSTDPVVQSFNNFVLLNSKTSTIEIPECPICLCDIDGPNNKVVTECGHTFHCSCLMQNVAHNGFGCPYCRTAMAEEIADDFTDDYTEYSDDDDVLHPENIMLRGFRMFNNNINGEDHTIEDIDEENEYQVVLQEILGEDEGSVWETDSEADSVASLEEATADIQSAFEEDQIAYAEDPITPRRLDYNPDLDW